MEITQNQELPAEEESEEPKNLKIPNPNEIEPQDTEGLRSIEKPKIPSKKTCSQTKLNQLRKAREAKRIKRESLKKTKAEPPQPPISPARGNLTSDPTPAVLQKPATPLQPSDSEKLTYTSDSEKPAKSHQPSTKKKKKRRVIVVSESSSSESESESSSDSEEEVYKTTKRGGKKKYVIKKTRRRREPEPYLNMPSSTVAPYLNMPSSTVAPIDKPEQTQRQMRMDYLRSQMFS